MSPRANKTRATIMKKQRRQWNAHEKIAIIMYHENHGNSKNKTASKFSIETKQLRDWISKKPQLLKAQPGLKRLNRGSSPRYPALEAALVEWIKEQKTQHVISRSMIQMKAKAFAQQRQWKIMCPGIESFAFSNKWLDGLMSRNNLSNRRHTTTAQRLPDDLVEKQQEFLGFLMYRRIQHDYPLALIGNMDETPMIFDLPSNSIDELGAKSITTGHEKTSFTVVLTCMADGTKLPPLVIFKLKNIPQGNFPSEIAIRANPTGWMNENEMLYWIENIWIKRAKPLNPRSLLVLDSFSAHIVDSVKRRFGEKNTNIAVIPGGLTSRLQPLGVSINKSFKKKMRRNYNEWMDESVEELAPSYETVVNWVSKSWDAVDVGLIRQSFKCCGISNSRDGTEDEWIFDYDRLERARQPSNEVKNQRGETSEEEMDDGYYDEQGTNYVNTWDD